MPDTDPLSEWVDASLYNVGEDPLERENLIGRGECRDVVEELMRDISGVCRGATVGAR